MRSSLDCCLGHSYTHLLYAVLHLADCCKWDFLHMRIRNSSAVLIYHSFVLQCSLLDLWCSRAHQCFCCFLSFFVADYAAPDGFALSLTGLFGFFSAWWWLALPSLRACGISYATVLRFTSTLDLFFFLLVSVVMRDIMQQLRNQLSDCFWSFKKSGSECKYAERLFLSRK